jgi:prolyl-tRNA editing enzyme YbaK/EbsC (Cys-tRNA(Pro) deacylase)
MVNLDFEIAIKHPELVSPTINELLNKWTGHSSVNEILVAPINPEFADSAKFCDHYQVDPKLGANCVIVEAVRGDKRTLAACLIPVSCKADLNKTARKTLNARRVSFAPLQEVLELTKMEYGGVTPIGLPADWPILIDSQLINVDRLIIGGGYRRSKVSIPGKMLNELPNAIILDGLGIN